MINNGKKISRHEKTVCHTQSITLTLVRNEIYVLQTGFGHKLDLSKS